MLSATLLALAAAVLHAGWNLAVKTSVHDRFLALWAQFCCGGVIAAGALVVTGGPGWVGWRWAAISGCVHLPYCLLLGRAYGSGDFSQVYPMARGGGAFLAAIGGVVVLGDRMTSWGMVAIATIPVGLALLAGRARQATRLVAAAVAITICTYTLLDSKGSRVTDVAGADLVDKIGYGLATSTMTMASLSLYGIATGRVSALVAAVRTTWRTFLIAGVASLITYTLVLIAVRSASVGYVAALRESSVVLAAFLGWRFLGEGDSRRRLAASGVVLTGLVLLVTLGR